MIDVKHVVPVTLLAQACVSLAVGAGVWLWVGEVAAVSALLGGAAAVVPNAFLAARLVAPSRDQSAHAMLRDAWVGEFGKVLLAVLMFGLIFGFVRPIEPLAVFATYLAAQLVVLGALLLGGGGGEREAMTKS